MTDDVKRNKGTSSTSAAKIVIPVVALIAVSVIVSMLIMAMSGDKKVRRQSEVRSVTLVKPPPPPPKIKEKPPEPEIEKEEIVKAEDMKQQIVEMEPEPLAGPDKPDEASDDDTKATDDQLGVDADGSGGADGFGLRAKKGGRSILSGGGGGGSGNGSGRFGWYTSMVQKTISDTVRDFLEKNGGIPEGELKALVRVELDDNGRIINYKLLRSSGNQRMDSAILKALASTGFDEIPPFDMPRALRFRVSSRGKA